MDLRCEVRLRDRPTVGLVLEGEVDEPGARREILEDVVGI
jgi:hypothetical protein